MSSFQNLSLETRQDIIFGREVPVLLHELIRQEISIMRSLHHQVAVLVLDEKLLVFVLALYFFFKTKQGIFHLGPADDTSPFSKIAHLGRAPKLMPSYFFKLQYTFTTLQCSKFLQNYTYTKKRRKQKFGWEGSRYMNF